LNKLENIRKQAIAMARTQTLHGRELSSETSTALEDTGSVDDDDQVNIGWQPYCEGPTGY